MLCMLVDVLLLFTLFQRIILIIVKYTTVSKNFKPPEMYFIIYAYPSIVYEHRHEILNWVCMTILIHDN